MEMKDIIDKLKDKIDLCKKQGKFFNKPIFEDESIVVTETDNGTSGSELLNYTYKIDVPEKGTIIINAVSKDKSRTFDVRPDVTSIMVKCSGFEGASEYDFADYWEEGLLY